jgi:sugar transferase (PEP-CTERM/EpsH1 system associated)
MTVLFLTHRLPYAPNRGDRIRAYYLLREMAQWADVSLFSLVHDDDEEERASKVPFATRVLTARVPALANRIRGTLRLFSSIPLTHTLLDAPDVKSKLTDLAVSTRPDVVVAFCSGMARFALSPQLDGFPIVVDMVDVDSVKWRDLAARAPAVRSWIYTREARTLEAFEREASTRARAVTVVNAREAEALRALAPGAPVTVVPNGVDVDALSTNAPPADEPVVVFTGMMDYEPNVEAVVWFARHVWPQVRQAHADARFVVVGAEPARDVRALAHADPSITVTGRVDEVQPYLWKAAVAVAPMRMARGVQNKALEALAAGLPVVTTSQVSAGLPEAARPGCVTADAPDEFARAVVGLLAGNSADRRARARRADVKQLDWRAQLSPLRKVLAEAAAR